MSIAKPKETTSYLNKQFKLITKKNGQPEKELLVTNACPSISRVSEFATAFVGTLGVTAYRIQTTVMCVD